MVDGVTHPDVAWSYEDPLPESLLVASLLSFEPDHPTLNLDAAIPPAA